MKPFPQTEPAAKWRVTVRLPMDDEGAAALQVRLLGTIRGERNGAILDPPSVAASSART